ncbi:Uncharacterised protein [Stenotrophomonas maltophilia]|nr:Uncharacterised protein [Stenotrophomonas maltophilia]
MPRRSPWWRRWHACRPANRSLPTDCVWHSAAPRLPVPPPAFPPWSERYRCRTSPKARRSAAMHSRRDSRCSCAPGNAHSRSRWTSWWVPATASFRVISSTCSSTCALPNPAPAARPMQHRRACCCHACACSAMASRTSPRPTMTLLPALKPMPATIRAPLTSPEAAAPRARAARLPSPHAARYWRYRWPTPTGCCWVHSRASCSWPCATLPMPASPIWRCSRRRAG